MIVSLRLRLLLWLLIPLALYVGISTSMSYRSAKQTAALIQDRELLASASMIAGQINWRDDGSLHVSIPPSALELFASSQHDLVYYQVVSDDGKLLAGRRDFPHQADVISESVPAYYTVGYNDQTIRVARHIRMLYDQGAPHKVTVLVGQTMREHDRIMDDLWKPSLRNQVVMLVLAIVLVVIGLTMELRPIIRLKDELVARDPMSLSPIRPGQLPIELRPIVEAINQYIQRLNAQIAAQKRFIADAAHQLRTPLTLLDSQIQFARQVDDRASQSETLKAIHGSSRGMADLVNKLLLLSQAEASNTIAFLRQPVDMIAVSSNVLVELIGLAQHKDIDLGLEAQTEQAWVIGNEGLLTAMVMNLVDNAIRYTQPGGKVTVSVTCDEKRVELIVVDNGPGISAEARTRVFERFYRNAAPGQEGTGLGLAIVKEIVQAAQGTVTLAPKREGEGLAVIVELPPAV